MKIAENHQCVSEIKDGISYLVPETIRNENTAENRLNKRLEALKEAGVNVDKMKELMKSSDAFTTVFKDLFADDDPIIKEIASDDFIRNPELFRRWITAQTFMLLKNPRGWTYALKYTYKNKYTLKYCLKQTLDELALDIKVQKKSPNDVRLKFFTLDDFKAIFLDLESKNQFSHNPYFRNRISLAATLSELYKVVKVEKWHFSRNCSLPSRWVNCFKGAGAYYTLQNIIRTHGLVIPGCKDKYESLDKVDGIFNAIVSYTPRARRWDLLMSLLSESVRRTKFELKY